MVSKSLRQIALGPVAVSCLLVASQSAAGQDDTGEWTLRRQSQSCYISRDFATNDGPLNVTILAFGPSNPYHFVLRGNAIPIRDERAEMASIGFQGEESAQDNLALIGGSKKSPTAVILAGAREKTTFRARFFSKISKPYVVLQGLDQDAPQTLFARFPNSDAFSLPLGDMSGEYARLNECAEAVDANLRAEAEDADPAVAPKLLNPQDFDFRVQYPQALLINRFSSIVEVAMVVSADGRAHDCVVRNSTWQPLFGKDTCKNYEQWARFEPARDAQGNAVSAMYSTAFAYMIIDW